jgi:hypothetical protein
MLWSIKNLMFHDKPVPMSNQRSLGYEKVIAANRSVATVRSSMSSTYLTTPRSMS